MLAVVEADRQMPVAAGMCLPDFRETVPGGDVVALAAALVQVEPADAGGVDLLARAVGWEQVIGMAQAAQARLLAELAARPRVGSTRVADELQAALSCTAYQAQRTVGRAQALSDHPALGDALAQGTVDLRRVDAVLDSLPLDGTPRRWNGVVAAALADAPLWSAPQLRRLTQRLVIAADPTQAQARCAQARADRGLELQPTGDGMALLTALLPAPAAVTVFTVVDALAGTTRTAHDDRDVHQRRADAFTTIFESIAATGALPDGTTLPSKRRRRTEIQVTVAATTLLGLDDLPGELAGYGPIPADMARQLAADGTWRRLLTDPVTGTLVDRGTTTYEPGADLTAFVIARDVTCTYMGCSQPGQRCELDHRTPYDPSRRDDQQTTAENLDLRCKHHHEQKTHGGWTVRRIPESGASEWTDPWGITFTRLAIPITLTATALAHLHGGAAHHGHDPGGDPPRPVGAYPDEPPF